MTPTDSSGLAKQATVIESPKTPTDNGELAKGAAASQSTKLPTAQMASPGTMPAKVTTSPRKQLSQWLIPGITVLLALLVLLLISTQWNWWVGWRTEQNTDDAYRSEERRVGKEWRTQGGAR